MLSGYLLNKRTLTGWGSVIMKFLITLVLLSIYLSISGCATTYTLTVHSIPEGSVLSWQGGGRIGETPYKIYYTHDERYMQNGCLRAHGITATWVSGAQAASSPQLLLCSLENEITLNRPTEAPGLVHDIRHAELLAQQRFIAEQRATEQMVEAAREAGEALGTLLSQ